MGLRLAGDCQPNDQTGGARFEIEYIEDKTGFMNLQDFHSDYTHIVGRLDQIIREQAGNLIHSHIEQIRGLARTSRKHGDKASQIAKRALLDAIDEPSAYQVTHAFSLYFQLVNICEERERKRRLAANSEPSMSYKWLFRSLKESRISNAKLTGLFENLEIEPVLTAHPTETKRRTVLTLLKRLQRSWEDPDVYLETLWHTEEVRQTAMEPLNEVDNSLFFFRQTIMEAAADCQADFERFLKEHYPDVTPPDSFITFASWVGGDRDGHPFVTNDVSMEAMRRQSKVAKDYIHAQCLELATELCHAQALGPKAVIDEKGIFQPAEKLRFVMHGLAEKVQEGAISEKQILAALEKVRAQLVASGAMRAANGRIDRLIRIINSFGFHLAHLDFRDNSEKLRSNPDEIKIQFETITAIQKEFGEKAAHRFILSMTTSAEDILLLKDAAYSVQCRKVDFIPLFETISDLNNSLDILENLWTHKNYRSHLARRNDIQEVMVGYSDSNKDGGYMAANWSIYSSQNKIVKLAKKHGVQIRFFHGKGGSIDRGGGASHRTLRAQPDAAANGRLRVTEQGEIISLKYSDPIIANRNLEQLTSAVVATQCLPLFKSSSSKNKVWHSCMSNLADASKSAYRHLVYETPEFLDYFKQATPIDLIEHLKIGSRPARRSKDANIIQLRAIPWVFAWTQSRHLISAWYGIGSAVDSFIKKDKDNLAKLTEMYAEWPLFSQLIQNAEHSLAKTDLGIAAHYAELVQDPHTRAMVFGQIEAEYDKTLSAVLSISGHTELLEDQPVLSKSLERRNPHVDPLHFLQIRFLEEWRNRSEKKRTETLRRLLALTVNGIAFGMKSSG